MFAATFPLYLDLRRRNNTSCFDFVLRFVYVRPEVKRSRSCDVTRCIHSLLSVQVTCAPPPPPAFLEVGLPGNATQPENFILYPQYTVHCVIIPHQKSISCRNHISDPGFTYTVTSEWMTHRLLIHPLFNHLRAKIKLCIIQKTDELSAMMRIWRTYPE